VTTCRDELQDLPELMLPKELAPVLRTTTASLADDRYLGRGIPFVRHGRKVLYRKAAVLAYLKANTITPESA